MVAKLAEMIKEALRLDKLFFGSLTIIFKNGKIVQIKMDKSILDPKTGELSIK